MNKKILFGLIGLAVLVSGLLFVSATLKASDNKPSTGETAKASSCGGSTGCGPGTCDGSCGGNCGNPNCGCAKNAGVCGENACDGNCGGTCGNTGCGCAN